MYFVDSSALVKLYFKHEPGTAAMQKLVHEHPAESLHLLELSRVEAASAVARLVRESLFDPQQARLVLDRLERDFRRFTALPLSSHVIESAIEVLQRHPLRSADAMQLAACLACGAGEDGPTFVCSDKRLLEAAEAEGLETLDPDA